MALSDDKLLEKCMHRKTQNDNECLNMVIWKRCPKDVYVGQHTLEMGVCSAILSFNDDISSIVSVMENYGLYAGHYTNIFNVYSQRIKEMNRKSTDNAKSARKQKRAVRKGFGDKHQENEGELYGPGICAV